jgi:hypothetical protein
MAFRVETSEAFEHEVEALLEWLTSSRNAGETDVRWFLALREAVESLSMFPARCPVAPENASFPFEVRHLLYGRKPHLYRILFTIEGETVYVLHLRHGRRLPLTS